MIIACEVGLQPPIRFVPRMVVSTHADVFISAAAGIFAGSGKVHISASHFCGEMITSVKHTDEAKKFVKIIKLGSRIT